jgi:hypothetical protein
MSPVNDFYEVDSDDNGEWSAPSLPVSRKRSLTRSSKRLRDKTATTSVEPVVDLELADEVEVSPPKRRRDGVGSKPCGNNDAAGNCAQILKGLRATEQDVGSEDLEQTSQDDESTNKHPQILSILKVPPKASGRQRRRVYKYTWEDRFGELTDYCETHGHCNVPKNYNKNTKLAKWVAKQRLDYRLHVKGKTSPMTTFRMQELKRLGFEWGSHGAAWEGRFSELADYCKEHGHCNVPRGYNDNPKLAKWIGTQRSNYTLHLEGKRSPMTTFRIQELKRIGFEWGVAATAWEDRLSAFADYRKIHGHCNVPDSYTGDTNLGKWVANQRNNCRLLLEGKKSPMTTFRFQELKRLGFEWDSHGTNWEDRLSELADYRAVHGHCNVPQRYKENAMLATWVTTQRRNYRLKLEGKSSPMTPFRIQALNKLDFEWKPTFSRRKGTPKKPNVDDDTTRVRERAVKSPKHAQQPSLKKTTVVKKAAAIKSTSRTKPNNPTGIAKSTSTSSRLGPQNTRHVEAGDAGFDETDLGDSPSKFTMKPSRYSDRQAAKSLLSLDALR